MILTESLTCCIFRRDKRLKYLIGLPGNIVLTTSGLGLESELIKTVEGLLCVHGGKLPGHDYFAGTTSTALATCATATATGACVCRGVSSGCCANTAISCSGTAASTWRRATAATTCG